MGNNRGSISFSAPQSKPFFFEGGEHGIVLIHGFTGSASHMRLIGEGLRDAGFTVSGINLPGHATCMEDMLNYTWEDWLRAAETAVKELQKKCKYVSVAGLSMGGVLSLLVAEKMNVTAVVAISAPMAVQNPLMPFAKWGSKLVKTTMWKNDPKRYEKMQAEYDCGYPGFPTRSAYDLSVLIRMARKNLAAITCPLLAVQSHGDETISKNSADVIVAGASSKVKQALWLEKVPHVCTISPEYPRITAAMVEHLHRAEKDKE